MTPENSISDKRPRASVLITGVSSGIGNGLAHGYLQRGWTVYGVSRRDPADLRAQQAYHHSSLDLARLDAVPEALQQLLGDAPRLRLAILNAGILGQLGDMRNASLESLRRVMDINLWANKVVLDHLTTSVQLEQVVTVSSGASVNGHRGWAGYAISKAALNMMTALYAAENPHIHFCALAPGVVDSEIQEQIYARPQDQRFPSLENLKAKRYTDQMPTPDVAAERLIGAIQRLPELVRSGAYADIRQPPISAT